MYVTLFCTVHRYKPVAGTKPLRRNEAEAEAGMYMHATNTHNTTTSQLNAHTHMQTHAYRKTPCACMHNCYVTRTSDSHPFFCVAGMRAGPGMRRRLLRPPKRSLAQASGPLSRYIASCCCIALHLRGHQRRTQHVMLGTPSRYLAHGRTSYTCTQPVVQAAVVPGASRWRRTAGQPQPQDALSDCNALRACRPVPQNSIAAARARDGSLLEAVLTTPTVRARCGLHTLI